MASVVDIWNMALAHIGADASVVSSNPPDQTVEAGHCARFWPIARKEALELAKWSWAKTRTALAPVANPSTVWAYAYALPPNVLSPMRVLRLSDIAQVDLWLADGNALLPSDLADFTERGSADFDVEGGVLLTNEPDAVLLYTQDITDTTKYTATFTAMVSYLLASYLAGPIIKGDQGAQAAMRLRQIAGTIGATAAADDANGSAEGSEFTPSALAARR